MIYVIAQFLFLGLLIWPLANLQFSLIGSVLIVIAMLVALFALVANRLGNFHVRPVPKVTGELITSGIYRYIRHPMYCSLFFGGLGVLLFQFIWWKLIVWILLIITLHFKARFEERALVDHYPAYQSYQKTNHSFIPFIW